MDPEVQESLNYLRPPVLRLYKNCLYFPNTPRRQREESHVPQHSNNWDLRDTTSSLTLLKKSEENLIFQKYSVLSYTDLKYSAFPDLVVPSPPQSFASANEPFINVTITGNDTNNKRKKRNFSKRVQTSFSNQENSVKSEEIYFVVKNRKGQKLYEIKSTGSAELSNPHKLKYDNYFNQNLKLLVQSLNMDTKKKKGKKKSSSNQDEEDVDDNNLGKCPCKCMCSEQQNAFDLFGTVMETEQMEQNVQHHLKMMQERKMRTAGKSHNIYRETPVKEEPSEQKPTYHTYQMLQGETETPRPTKKSQVTITGKLGLNAQDQYVLRCDAKIDDKPFHTVYKTEKPLFCRPCLNKHSEENSKTRYQRDSMVQVDLVLEDNQYKNTLQMTPNSLKRCQETQCKPANFNQVCFSNAEVLKALAQKDQTVQCNCANNSNEVTNKVIRSERTAGPIFTNPLVVISVYPKNDSQEVHIRDESPVRSTRIPKHAADKASNVRKSNLPSSKPESKVTETKVNKRERSPIRSDQSTTAASAAIKTSRSPVRSPVKNQKGPTQTENPNKSPEIVHARSRSTSPSSSPTRKANNKFAEIKEVKKETRSPRPRSPERNIATRLAKNTNTTATIQRETKVTHETQTKEMKSNQKYSSKNKHSPINTGPNLIKMFSNEVPAENSSVSSKEIPVKKQSGKKKALTAGVNTDGIFAQKTETVAHFCECTGPVDADDNNISNFAVSIDGENNFYDILFRKDTHVGKDPEREKNLSLHNFVGTDSSSILDKNTFNTTDQSESSDSVPELRFVQDSIELFQRRQDQSDSKLMVRRSLIRGSKNYPVIPSRHHYRGDSCTITNPIERDKEIRELLGIGKVRGIPTTSPVSSGESSTGSPNVGTPIGTPSNTPVGTPLNTPVISPVETPSSSGRNSKEVFSFFPSGHEYEYDFMDMERVENVNVTAQKTNERMPKIFSYFPFHKNYSTNGKKQEKLPLIYESYQPDVLYGRNNRGSFNNNDIPVNVRNEQKRQYNDERRPTMINVSKSKSNGKKCGSNCSTFDLESLEIKESTSSQKKASTCDEFTSFRNCTMCHGLKNTKVKKVKSKQKLTKVFKTTYESRRSKSNCSEFELETEKKESRSSQKETSIYDEFDSFLGNYAKNHSLKEIKVKRVESKQKYFYTQEITKAKPKLYPLAKCCCYSNTKCKHSKPCCPSHKGTKLKNVKSVYKLSRPNSSCSFDNVKKTKHKVKIAKAKPGLPKHYDSSNDVQKNKPELFQSKPCSSDTFDIFSKQSDEILGSKPLYLDDKMQNLKNKSDDNRPSMISNRNLNICLQIEMVRKKKPIILSRQQYEKVKKTIEKAKGQRPHMLKKSYLTGDSTSKSKQTLTEHKYAQTEYAVQVKSLPSVALSNKNINSNMSPTNVMFSNYDVALALLSYMPTKSNNTAKDLFVSSNVKERDDSAVEKAYQNTRKGRRLSPSRQNCNELVTKPSQNYEHDIKILPCKKTNNGLEVKTFEYNRKETPLTEEKKYNSVEKSSQNFRQTSPCIDNYKDSTAKGFLYNNKDKNTVIHCKEREHDLLEKSKYNKNDQKTSRYEEKLKKLMEKLSYYEKQCLIESLSRIALKFEGDDLNQQLKQENKKECLRKQNPSTIVKVEKHDPILKKHAKGDGLQSENMKCKLVSPNCDVNTYNRKNKDSKDLLSQRLDSARFPSGGDRENVARTRETLDFPLCCKLKHNMNEICNMCLILKEIERDALFPLEISLNDKKYLASSSENVNNSTKHVTFTSSKLGCDSKEPLECKRSSDTLYTIFKGHRKTPSPNLGTSSVDSLSEKESLKSCKYEPTEDVKHRRPFLKRLMSCLVMRSKISDANFGRPPPLRVETVNTSVDSYHINTSLGAVEMSSSIFDTSESFYTNHTILPINSKIKKGFFHSVRGFLTHNRR